MKLVMDTTVQNPDTLQWSEFPAGTEKSDLPAWAQTAITNPYAYDDRVRDERIDLVCQRLLMHGAPDAMVDEVRDSLEAKVADDDEAVVEALQVSQDAEAVRQAIADYNGLGEPVEGAGAIGPDGTLIVLPLYTVEPDTAIDAERWHDTGLVTPDGERLYTFSEDVAGEPAKGDDGVWHVYEGSTEEAPVEPPTTDPNEPPTTDPNAAPPAGGEQKQADDGSASSDTPAATEHDLAPKVETPTEPGDVTPKVAKARKGEK